MANNQLTLPISEATSWAEQRGLRFDVFIGWHTIVRDTLFWGDAAETADTAGAVKCIYDRLVELEVSSAGIEDWARRFDTSETSE